MYKIKEEKKEELKSGRTYTYLSAKTGLTDRYLKAVFSGGKCRRITAIALISVRHEIPITSSEMNYYLEYYFNAKEEEE